MARNAASSRTVRYAALVTVVTLSTAFAGSIAVAVYLASNPEEVDLTLIAPWLAVGAAIGWLLWYVLNPDRRHSSKKHRKHRHAEPSNSASH